MMNIYYNRLQSQVVVGLDSRLVLARSLNVKNVWYRSGGLLLSHPHFCHNTPCIEISCSWHEYCGPAYVHRIWYSFVLYHSGFGVALVVRICAFRFLFFQHVFLVVALEATAAV